MRISSKGRYSLEALLFLGLKADTDYVSTRTISGETGISDGYLEQLFMPLRRAGLVQGIRGPQGGYHLGKGPEQITVGDILRAVEGPLNPAVCDQNCALEATCLSRHTWRELYQEIRNCVDSITLQDLIGAYRGMDQPEYVI